jgi:hypothetical protein
MADDQIPRNVFNGPIQGDPLAPSPDGYDGITDDMPVVAMDLGGL